MIAALKARARGFSLACTQASVLGMHGAEGHWHRGCLLPVVWASEATVILLATIWAVWAWALLCGGELRCVVECDTWACCAL